MLSHKSVSSNPFPLNAPYSKDFHRDMNIVRKLGTQISFRLKYILVPLPAKNMLKLAYLFTARTSFV